MPESLAARPSRLRDLGLLAASGLAVAAAAAGGGVAASRAGDVYGALELPSWAPPAGAFGPVWTVLYGGIAVSGWLLARAGTGRRDVRRALVAFGVQLALNAAWTPLFFAAEAYGWALADIVAMAVAITVTIALAWRVSRAAALLLVPYLAWVLFATALNIAIVVLN